MTNINVHYRVEDSTQFVAWTVQASNLLATTTTNTWSIPWNGATRFYRVMRQP